MKKTMQILCGILALTVSVPQLPVQAITGAQTEQAAEAEAEKITDIELIRELFTQYIADNGLDAVCVSDEAYPQYAGTVIVECNSETAANTAILQFAKENNIERTAFNLIPCFDGKPVTTADPNMWYTTTTTTATTVMTTPTTITTSPAEYVSTEWTTIQCYVTYLEYDSSPMKVGETRTVRFYNPILEPMTTMIVSEVFDNISYNYEEGSDTFTITALAPGKAHMYIMGEGCAFGDSLNLEIVDDTATTTTTISNPINPVFTSTTLPTNAQGRLVDENGEVIIVNGTSAVMTQPTTTTITTALSTDAQGRLVDENGEVIIVNGTSAVMTQPTTTTITTALSTDAQGRLVDENGEVIIVNGTSAVMTMPTTTTTTTPTTTTDEAAADLPQTGNNSVTNILIAIAALFLTAAGSGAVYASGVLRRKEDEK